MHVDCCQYVEKYLLCLMLSNYCECGSLWVWFNFELFHKLLVNSLPAVDLVIKMSAVLHMSITGPFSLLSSRYVLLKGKMTLVLLYCLIGKIIAGALPRNKYDEVESANT